MLVSVSDAGLDVAVGAGLPQFLQKRNPASISSPHKVQRISDLPHKEFKQSYNMPNRKFVPVKGIISTQPFGYRLFLLNMTARR